MGLVADLVQTLERRQQGALAHPSPALREALGAVPTATGAHVNPETAMSLTTVYACVGLLAETIASLPWQLFRRQGRSGDSAGRAPAPEHPVYRLLHDAPNPEMTAFEFLECLVGHLETWGNAFAEIELDQRAQPRALWPLRPDRMEVERIPERQERRLRYKYAMPSGRLFVFPTDRVLHIRLRSPDGLIGLSPISEQRETLGLGVGLDQYAGRFFGNDSRPGGVLEVEGRLSPDAAQRLKTQWETAHQGFTRAHRVAVLEEGVSWKAVGLPPQDAQFLEQRKFQKSEIASIWRIPPHMLGDVERNTSWGSGIEQMSIGFVQFTLRSRLKRIEQRANRSLLAPEEAGRYYSEFEVDGLLRGDSRSRAQLLQTMRQNGVLNADEWRALENLNALPDGQGTLYLAPANLVPLESLVAPPEPPPATPPATLTAGTNGTPSGTPPAPTPRAAERTGAREYRCRACGHLLFSSPDERGRITTVCPNRRCRTYQTVLVGGLDGRLAGPVE